MDDKDQRGRALGGADAARGMEWETALPGLTAGGRATAIRVTAMRTAGAAPEFSGRSSVPAQETGRRTGDRFLVIGPPTADGRAACRSWATSRPGRRRTDPKTISVL